MNTLKLEVVRFDSEDVIATSTAHRVRNFSNYYATLGAEAYEAGYDDSFGSLSNGTLYPIEFYSTDPEDFFVEADIALDENSGSTYAWYIGGDIDAWYTDGKSVYYYTNSNISLPR